MRRIFMGLLHSVLGVLLVVFFCAPDSVDAFQAPGPEKNLTDDKLPRAFQPSAAWIRSAQYQNGYALVAYSVGDLQTEKAAWSRSPGGWTLATPVWGNAHVWDEPGLRWPDPENFCELYRCEDGAKWKNYDRAAQAVWTGLDDVAVIVAVGHDDAKIPINSLVVLSSKNGGENFKQATIISLTTPEGESGGGIDPDSVHASLMYTPERTNAAAGKKAIPIYVIWRNSSLSGEGWWMATFTVGINGGVALLTRPKKISAIAKTVAGYASVLAFQDDNLAEVVEIAWAERLDAAGNPSSGPVCPSTTNIRVKWWKTFSRNYSASDVPTWGAAQLVDEDRFWRPCVGPSFAGQDAPAFGVNNDRPEYVMSRGKPYTWYMAINKTVQGRSRVHVRKFPGPQGTGTLSSVAYISPNTETSTNVMVKDAWGQALAVHQGNTAVKADVAVVYRVTDDQNRHSMGAASSTDWGVSWTTQALSTTTWSLTDKLGLYNGLTVIQVCINAPCPPGPQPPPKVPFLAAWPDIRSPATSPDIWVSKFEP